MPAKSKAQYRFMKMILDGFRRLRLKKKAPPRSVAEEFVKETPRPGALPERVSPKRKLKRKKPSKSESASGMEPHVITSAVSEDIPGPIESYKTYLQSSSYGVRDYPSQSRKRLSEKQKQQLLKKLDKSYKETQRISKNFKRKVAKLKRKHLGGFEPSLEDF